MANGDQKFEVPGFQASGIAAGIKEDGKKDLALLHSEVPAKAAGVFTTNVFKAAPVLLDMERIKQGSSQAIIINSGNANAATGDEGYQDAVKMARFCAGALQIDEAQVLVATEVAAQILDVLDGRPARYAVNAPLLTPETAQAIAPYSMPPSTPAQNPPTSKPLRIEPTAQNSSPFSTK